MKFENLKFLADENIDREVIEFLREQGFSVVSVVENGWFAWSDLSLLEFAYREHLVVISQDSDFGTLVFRDQIPFYGIIYLRPGHQSPDVHIESINAIQNAGIEFITPFILVTENGGGNHVRIRFRIL